VTTEERPRLTKAAVVEQALKLADTDGPEALTIRRLADQLGVTPMAIYWHFKNKEQLLTAAADHVMGEVRPDLSRGGSWDRQLRTMVEALVRVLRAHPSAPALLRSADKTLVESFVRATDAALTLLREAGFPLEEGYQVAGYLLHHAIGLVEMEPGRIPGMSPEEATECIRQHRLALQALPPGRFPALVEYASAHAGPPDLEAYYAFGIDLMMAGVEAVAARRAAGVSRRSAARRPAAARR
jgi:TetR/AcrR family transcriptional regulator, tetracycline repressor protein